MYNPKQLSREQQFHQRKLVARFAGSHATKYTKGAIEHDSNLWEFSDDDLIAMAYEEVLDLVSYLGTLIENRQKNEPQRY